MESFDTSSQLWKYFNSWRKLLSVSSLKLNIILQFATSFCTAHFFTFLNVTRKLSEIQILVSINKGLLECSGAHCFQSCLWLQSWVVLKFANLYFRALTKIQIQIYFNFFVFE